MRDVAGQLAELLRYAAAGGAPSALLKAGGVLTVDLLDPVLRKRLVAVQEARQEADAIEAARRDGSTLNAACRAAGVSTRTHQRRRRREGDKLVSPIGEALQGWKRS